MSDYYSAAIRKFGATARGVDWPNSASQHLRFVQLLKVCDFGGPFSLNDFGCGYGALLEFLAWRHPDTTVRYHGVDISPSMVEAARALWDHDEQASFCVGSGCCAPADYSLASGVFNVRLGTATADWEAYVEAMLSDINRISRRGFSVNFMRPREDGHVENELYRTLPDRWVCFCRDKLCRKIELVQDYGLREFTLLCRA